MSLLLFLVLLLLQFPHMKKAAKISERFSNIDSSNAKCVVQIPQVFANVPLESLPKGLAELMGKVWTFHKINCSLEPVLYEPSEANENGSYNGLIGMIQEHRQDLGFFMIRPDSLPFEPGKLTSPVFPADVTLITRRNKSRVDMREITNFLNLDFVVYFDSFIALFFISATLYAFAETLLRVRGRFTIKRFVKKFQETVWKIGTLLCDQEMFHPTTTTGQVLSFSVSIFFLITICGILLNTVGADLIAVVMPPKVNSLDDLLKGQLQPYISKNLYLYEMLRTADKGSKYNQLWNRIQSHEGAVISFDLKSPHFMEDFNKLVDDIDSSKAAFILPDAFLVEGFKSAACLYFKKMENTTKAEQLFAPGILTSLMSWKIHPYTEKVINYIYTTLLETQILTAAISLMKTDIQLSMYDGQRRIKYDSKIIECVNRIDRIPTQEYSFQPFQLRQMKGLFTYYFYLSLATFVPFIFTTFRHSGISKFFFKRKIVIKIRRQIVYFQTRQTPKK